MCDANREIGFCECQLVGASDKSGAVIDLYCSWADRRDSGRQERTRCSGMQGTNFEFITIETPEGHMGEEMSESLADGKHPLSTTVAHKLQAISKQYHSVDGVESRLTASLRICLSLSSDGGRVSVRMAVSSVSLHLADSVQAHRHPRDMLAGETNQSSWI